MADSTLPLLPGGSALSDTDLLYAVQGAGTTDVKVTALQVKTYAATAPGGSSGQLQYDNAGAFGGANFYIEDANTVAQRNGTTAQASYVYNTYTNASNYERGIYRWSSNVLELGFDKLGTGVDRNVRIRAGNNKEVQFTNASGFGCTVVDCNQGGFRSYSAGYFGWASGEATLGSSYDTAFARASAGVVALFDGSSTSNLRDLKVRGLIHGTSYTVATLPTASTVGGGVFYVTDATATTNGTAPTGGGSNKVLVKSDGSAYVILG